MTRLASTGWASALLGLAFTGAAFAQGARDDKNDDMNDNTARGDMPTDTEPTVQAEATDLDTHTPSADVYVPPPAPAAPVERDYSVAPAPIVVEEDQGPLSGIGIALAAGGGVGGFTDDTMSNTTNVGGDWDVRLTLGTRSPIAFEGSYIGSAQSIDALGLDNDAILVGNGVQGALRFNANFDLPVQPFAFGGAAWRRYDLTNADTNLSDVAGSDNVLEVPLGLGIAGRWGNFMLDARGEYRLSADEDLVPSANRIGDTANMDRWGVKGTVGVEF